MNKKEFFSLLALFTIVWMVLSLLFYFLFGEEMFERLMRVNYGMYKASLPGWLIAAYLVISEVIIIRFIIKKFK